MRNFLFIFLIIPNLIIAQVLKTEEKSGFIYSINKYDSSNEQNVDTISLFKNDDNKIGVLKDNKIIINPIYDQIEPINKNYIVTKNNKKGLIDSSEFLILPIIFDSIEATPQSFIVKKEDRWESFDLKGKRILKAQNNKIVYSCATSNFSLIKNKKSNELEIYIFGKKSKYRSNTIILFNNATILKQEEKYGLLYEGEMFLDFEYDNITLDGESLEEKFADKMQEDKFIDVNDKLSHFFVEKDKKFGLYLDKQLIVPIDLDEINYQKFKPNTVIFKKNKLRGAFIFETHKLIEPNFDFIIDQNFVYDSDSNDNLKHLKLRKDGYFGIIDYSLNEILPIVYDEIKMDENKLNYIVKRNSKIGLTDKDGKIVIPIIYDKLEKYLPIKEGLYKVEKDNKVGIINSNNQIIIPIEFKKITEDLNLILVETENDKYGLYNLEGEKVLEPFYDLIVASDAGFITSPKSILALKDNKYSLVDNGLNIHFRNDIIDFYYLLDNNLLKSSPKLFARNSYLALKNSTNKVGVYNELENKLIIPFKYDNINQIFQYSLDEAYFLVQFDGLFGIIDSNNKIIIPIQYQDLNMNNFCNFDNCFIASKNGKYGIIDINNKIKTDFLFDDISNLNTINIYKAKINGKYKLINQNGKSLTSETFDEISHFENEHALTFNKGKMRLLNKNAEFQNSIYTMSPHNGFLIFDEVIEFLIQALESENDQKIIEFVDKIFPSEHIIYVLKDKQYFDKKIDRTILESNKKSYTEDLLKFKHDKWKTGIFDKKKLTDDVFYSKEVVEKLFQASKRNSHGDFDLEVLLRVDFRRINGYWVSLSFFDNY
jgi:hypothetical protein